MQSPGTTVKLTGYTEFCVNVARHSKDKVKHLDIKYTIIMVINAIVVARGLVTSRLACTGAHERARKCLRLHVSCNLNLTTAT